MGLGSENPRNKMYYLNLRSKRDKKVDPHFTVETKVDGNMTKLPDETEVSGQLMKIGHGEYTWESERGPKKERTISIHLLDRGREFKVELNVNSSLARNVMNTILSVDVIGTLVMRVYVKDGFPKIFLENDGQSLGWKYKWKEDGLEAMTEKVPDPQAPGEFITVYHKLNDFLLNAWIGHGRLLNENVKAFLPKTPAPEEAKTNVFEEKLKEAAPAGSLQNEFDKMPSPADHVSDGPGDDKDSVGSDDLPF